MKRSMMITALGLASLLLSSEAWATPIITPHVGATLTLNAGSVYNPRIFGGYNYATNLGVGGLFGQWKAGSSTPEFTRNPAAGASEQRMVGGFLGAESSTYLMATGGVPAPTNLFTRYDFDGTDPVSVTCPVGDSVSTYAWTGTPNQMVYNLYKPAAPDSFLNDLVLANVTPNPFAVTAVTTGVWNGDYNEHAPSGIGGIPGIVATLSPYIRTVTVGSTNTNYAYYGDGGTAAGGSVGTSLKFWAMNLDTAEETELGVFGPLQVVPGGGSYYNIVWAVVERDGYLYVEVPRGDANGDVIKVYEMTDATTLGGVVATYTWAELQALTGEPTYYLGLDVSPDGSRMLISGTQGKAFELIPLMGDANMDDVVNDADASILGANWMKATGATWKQGDFNYDGAVNDKDAAILAAHWTPLAGNGEVPEPSTLAMLFGAAVMAWLVRRSR